MLFLFSFLYTVGATGIHTESIKCPIGEDRAKTFFVLSENEYGGYDSDGATYSSGMQPRKYAIATCSKNLYSALNKDMEQTWTAEEEKEILAIIEQNKKNFAKAELPETWERYDIAIDIYRWQGKSHQFLAGLYMDAAWTIRDEAVGIHEDLRGPIVADQVLELGRKELQKNLNTEQRKMVLFNLARVAHRNARFDEREEFLTAFNQLSTLTEAERKAAKDFGYYTTELEPQYLRKAQKELLSHIAENPNDGQALYLLGDIARRLGETESAQRFFNQANLTADLQEEQRNIILYLLKK